MPSWRRRRSCWRPPRTDETLGDLIATLGSIDDDEIDWPNVRQTTVLIQQSFSYEYPGPITALRHRLMVVPPDYHDDQRLLTHKIRVSGCDVDTERSYDTFGNVVLDLSLEHVEREVTFTTWAVVEREAAVDGKDAPDAISFDQRFADTSRLTRPDDALRAVADELRSTGALGLELAEQISRRVYEHFEYRWDVTAVTTTAAEAWAGGLGVCQDYAHCMLALCRLCGLPARYVSGHVLGDGGRTRGWRCSSSIRRTRRRCAPFPSTPPTTAAPACATSPSRWDATTATCRRPRAPSTRPTTGR